MPMRDFLIVVLVLLTTYRITRLLVKDSFPPIAVLRARIGERFGDDSSLAYLAQCSWCAGLYVAALVVGGYELAAHLWLHEPGVPFPVLVVFAASGVTGFLAAWDDGFPEKE